MAKLDAKTIEAIEERVVRRCLEDESYKQGLLADPRTAVEQELGASLPEEIKVRAIEGEPDTIWVVVPSGSPQAEREGEISAEDLERVAGGGVVAQLMYER